ncbi:MAG: U32 family peptidase [Bacilli bacterium]|nr:U32 family peptidase [Bacilli bacterium]
MNKIELLAPAGNLEKAKIALLYGADAVYVGGKSFSLRARASNFTISDILDLCNFAHGINKKVYVTMNIIPHDEDLNDLEKYLKDLDSCGVDAIITSSLFIIKTCENIAPRIERHVSTQMSITNSNTINHWKQMNVSRVVLARENTLEEIKHIANNTNLELEVFIHGGMCSSYSGRCVLSNHMTDRDANRGGCAHSCRWNYHLYEGSKKLNKKNQFYNIGSKDLMAIRFIPNLIDLNVASLKIEGRMKSTYYLATVVGCYRKIIDLYYKNGTIKEEEFVWFENEIAKAENRLTSVGFYNGIPTINEQLYDTRCEQPTQEYIGYVLDYNDGIATIEQRNYFCIGDLVEAFGPNLENTRFIIEKLIDCETNALETVARHPLQKFYINCPVKLSKHDMLRKVK